MRALRARGGFLVAVLGMLGGACSQQGGNTDDGKTPPSAEVVACRERIAAKTDEVKAAGIDIDNWSIDDAVEMAELVNPVKQTADSYQQFDGHYRPLTNHPGCSIDNLYYNKANKDGTTPYKDGNNDGKWTGAEDSAFARGGRGFGATQHGAEPREQDFHAERLGDVIIGAELEPGHPVALARLGREHDDRQMPRV